MGFTSAAATSPWNNSKLASTTTIATAATAAAAIGIVAIGRKLVASASSNQKQKQRFLTTNDVDDDDEKLLLSIRSQLVNTAGVFIGSSSSVTEEEEEGKSYILNNVRIPLSLLQPKSTSRSKEQEELFADDNLKYDYDEELEADGFVNCRIEINGKGKISNVRRINAARNNNENNTDDGSKSSSSANLQTTIIDCEHGIVLPCFVDSHVHLVKTQSHSRARNPTGTINDALFVELNDQSRWSACPCCRPNAMLGGSDVAVACTTIVDETEEEKKSSDSSTSTSSSQTCEKAGNDIERRIDFGLRTAYYYGTKIIRTHLDGTGQFVDQKLRRIVFDAYKKSRTKYSKLGMDVQGVANLYLPLWNVPDIAERHVEELLKEGGPNNGLILGAYCGNQKNAPPNETLAAMDALFEYALRHKFQVDLHIDETNDPDCCLLETLIISLKKIRSKGYNEHVLLGHCTSLSLVNESKRNKVIQELAKFNNNENTDGGKVIVVCNPNTNMGLQDRRGSTAPQCVPIPKDTPRTPIWRGITSIQELDDAGVCCGAASDNVRDYWHPYGDYDPISNLKGAITMCQLDTVPNEGYWTKLITTAFFPTTSSSSTSTTTKNDDNNNGNNNSSLFGTGNDADLVLFPNARTASELFSRPNQDQQSRCVLRKGRLQNTQLPNYRELDDITTNRNRTRIIEEKKTEKGLTGSIVGMEG